MLTTEVEKPQKVDGMQQRLTVAKATSHKASPIPQRAKFLRKFGKKGGKKAPAPVKKKEKKEAGEREVEDKMAEERKREKIAEEGREDVTAAGREIPASLDTQQPVKEMKVGGQ